MPDATIIGMVAWQGWVAGRTTQQIFGIDYFSPGWQEIFAISNSIPIFLVALLAGIIMKRPWLVALAAAALLHVITDIPLHVDDGHAPFWPFSDWVYASPYSYWDVRHGARYIAPAEFLLAAGMALWIWRRHPYWLTRIAVGFCVAVEAMFALGGELLYGS